MMWSFILFISLVVKIGAESKVQSVKKVKEDWHPNPQLHRTVTYRDESHKSHMDHIVTNSKSQQMEKAWHADLTTNDQEDVSNEGMASSGNKPHWKAPTQDEPRHGKRMSSKAKLQKEGSAYEPITMIHKDETGKSLQENMAIKEKSHRGNIDKPMVKVGKAQTKTMQRGRKE